MQYSVCAHCRRCVCVCVCVRVRVRERERARARACVCAGGGNKEVCLLSILRYESVAADEALA